MIAYTTPLRHFPVLGLVTMTVANIVTFITALSMSAVCTNGQIKGGDRRCALEHHTLQAHQLIV